MQLMETELQELRQQVAEGTDMERLLSIFEDGYLESGSPDKRSRRKQVDALLEAITNRPGRLVFKGNVTAIAQVANQNDVTKSFATGLFDIFATTSFGNGTLLFVDLETIGGDGHDQTFVTLPGVYRPLLFVTLNTARSLASNDFVKRYMRLFAVPIYLVLQPWQSCFAACSP